MSESISVLQEKSTEKEDDVTLQLKYMGISKEYKLGVCYENTGEQFIYLSKEQLLDFMKNVKRLIYQITPEK